jgi:hypothetical protein
LEEVLDDIQDVRCDKCYSKILFKEDLRESFVFAGEEQKTHFLSNSERYTIRTEPFSFNICRNCVKKKRRFDLIGLSALVLIGVAVMFLPYGMTSGVIGFAIVGLTITAALETDIRKQGAIDELAIKSFSTKYSEHYDKKKTRLFSRRDIDKMNPVYSINAKEFMDDIKKRNEEIMEMLKKFDQKKGS